jgi:Tfp pilus assembly protein PilV
MKYWIKWFSLIEVVIATSIISISVFWIYKLIWENTKIINNSSDYLQVNSLFPILENCIENIWFSSIDTYSVDDKIDFNLWDTWSLNECNISWSDKVIIDDVEYELSSIIKNKTSEYIELELQISSEKTKTMTWYYKQIKNPNF